MASIEALMAAMARSLPAIDAAQRETSQARIAGALADAGVSEVTVTGRLEAHGHDLRVWDVLAVGERAVGFAIPVAMGGSGSDGAEIGAVFHQLGRVLAPTPYLSTALAARAVACSQTAAPDLIGSLVTGEVAAAVAVTATTSPGELFPASITARGDDTEVTLDGAASSVLSGEHASMLVVPAIRGSEPVMAAVRTGSGSGVSQAHVTSLDETRPLADLQFAGSRGRVLCSGPKAEGLLGQVLLAGSVYTAMEQTGLARQCLQDTVDYLKKRFQFGRAVGSFQALKHRIADLWVDVVTAESIAAFALAQLDRAFSSGTGDGPDAAAEPANTETMAAYAAVAKFHCSRVALHAAEERVQLHGGLGVTWQDPSHLYLKRAMAQNLLFGTPNTHLAAFARYLADTHPSG